jgi:DNA repair protein RadD
MTDIPVFDIGVCCAGLGERVLGKRLTIGTIQTFVNVAESYPGCDMLVIDEAHRISVGTNSQYDQTISILKDKTPNMRIVGCTATVGRLGHGYVYGERCRKGAINLFPRLNYQIKYSTLLELGYLCELRGKVSNAEQLESDLSNLDTTGGDYVLDQLGELLSHEIHLSTAVEAIKEHCADYKMICCFCCTIDHAERLKDLLGEKCTVIHSQLSPLQRRINMADWTSGRKRICTSINILSEGVDMPALQCLVMVRPTLSSTLFLQSVGRVLRPHSSKDHGFLLDLSGNVARFGTDLDNVKVGIPKAVAKEILKKDNLIKLCPSCEKEMFISLRICPNCGFEFPASEIIEANHVPELTAVKFEKKKAEPPQWYDVHDMYVDIHESRKNGKFLGRVEFECGLFRASLWLCFSDFYSGYAVEKAEQKWEMLVGYIPFPNNVQEFAECQTIVKPKRILVTVDTEYPDILDYEFEEVPWELADDVIEVFDGEPLPF